MSLPSRSIAIVPTYNEAANIEPLIGELLALGVPGLQVLVVDDNSPDGTSAIVRRLSDAHPEVLLAQRMNDRGRGTAGIVGFHLAMKLGADRIIEMDADFSHPPRCVPELLRALDHTDISIASRLCPGARDLRPASRRLVTWLANLYARAFLELPSHAGRIRDWTTGFRGYRRRVFEALPPEALISRGPSILQELLFRSLNLGLTASEIPFEMKDRAAGKSTFSGKVARQSLASIPAYRALFHPASTPRGALAVFQLSNYRMEKASPGHFLLRNP
ncbi:MAG: polyprenol monophosphomannose synthase [Oligoflexia bacterium]|nr:polyprenol monophosphomannose synthase [Oligoflexia bacterium]